MKIWGKYIKGGALSYVVFLMIVGIILVSGMITIAYYHFTFHENSAQKQLLQLHAHSVLHAAQYSPDISLPYDGKDLQITNNPAFTFEVDKKPWGLFEVLAINATYKNVKLKKQAFCGSNPIIDDSLTLYLSNFKDALYVSGNTLIEGTCYLPRLGVKKGHIGAYHEQHDSLVYGTIRKSKVMLPAYDTVKLTTIFERLKGKNSFKGEVMELKKIQAYTIRRSFNKRPLILTATEPLYLKDCNFEGHIAIISQKPVTLMASAKLKNIQIYAPKIVFAEGFSGNLQGYATDTIIVEKNAQINYPSSLGITTNIARGVIHIKEGAAVHGDVFLIDIMNAYPKNTFIYIEKDAELNGSLYCQGKVDLKGKIYGQLITREFMLKTKGGYYENNLLNITISKRKQSAYYINGTLFNNYPLKTIMYVD